VAGGITGLLIAKASLFVVHTVKPGNIPRLDVITLDGPFWRSRSRSRS
jgi:hypothetical protein